MDKSLILKEIMKVYDFDKKGDFADFLGINQQVISNWIKRNTFDIELIYTKCEKISAEFILTGKGEKLRKQENAYKNVENETLILSEPKANYGFYNIETDKDKLINTLQQFVTELKNDKIELQDDKKMLIDDKNIFKNIIENNFQKNVG